MRMEDRREILTTMLYYAAIGGLLYFMLRYLVSWLLPFLLGVAIAALLRPAALSLAKRISISERTAAVFVLIFFYLLLIGIVFLLLTILLAQFYELLLRLPELYAQYVMPLLERITGWFYSVLAKINLYTQSDLEPFPDVVFASIQQAALDGSTYLVRWVAGLVGKLPILLLGSLFTFMISLLTSLNYRQVGSFLYSLIPEQVLPRVKSLQQFFRNTVWQYVRAYTIILAMTFLELALGFWLLRFNYALPVAAAIALADLLPLIGSGTVLIPWGIVLIAGGDLVGGVGLLILFAVIEIIRNIMEPRIIGSHIGLHPIATIAAMYAGLKIAGFFGLLIAPVAVLFIRHLKNGTEPGPLS